MKSIAFCSYGKDSLAQLIEIKRLGLPLDEVVYVEIKYSDKLSGEHPAMAEWIPEARAILKEKLGIEVKHLCAKSTFVDYFYRVKERGRHIGERYGFPFVIGAFQVSYDDLLKMRGPARQYKYPETIYFDNTHNECEADIVTDVWRFAPTTQTEREDTGGHATPKPVALCERGVRMSCPEGGLVLDPFGGSGSTLIACENLGRRAYLVELSPHWCEVIIRRYEKLTGKKAIRAYASEEK